MKKFTLIFFLLFAALTQAQSISNGVRFFVGSGEGTAYFVVDFKNGTEDPSYVWGIKFDPNNPINGTEMLQLIADFEPNFSFEQYSGFLERIVFNHHDSYNNEYDNFSLWTSPNGSNWNMAGWMQSPLIDEMWYSASYGFGINVPGPNPPSTPLPALPSQAFTSQDVSTWIGTGNQSSIIVIDFDTTISSEPSSFAFGIRYDDHITAIEALDLIQNYYADFNYQASGNHFSYLQIGNHSIADITASVYTGYDLSSWAIEDDLHAIELSNNKWLGLSFGANRPYIPVEGMLQLSIEDHPIVQFHVHPNPVVTIINITSNQPIIETIIYSIAGQQLSKASTSSIDVSNLNSGIYIVEIFTNTGKFYKKFIKK